MKLYVCMALFSMLLMLLMVMTVEAARRANVVLRGTTTAPGFAVKGSKFSAKCPDGTYAFNNGTNCCSTPKRSSYCPNIALSQLLYWDDPLDCCDDETIIKCPEKNNVCTTKKVNVYCPAMHPFVHNHGLSCCRYFARGTNCTTGAAGTQLTKTDPEECCNKADLLPCLTDSGDQTVCYSNQNSSTFCGYGAPNSIRLPNGKGLLGGSAQGMFAMAASFCANASMPIMQIRTKEDMQQMIKYLGIPVQGNQYWVDAYHPTTTPSCVDQACNGIFHWGGSVTVNSGDYYVYNDWLTAQCSGPNQNCFWWEYGVWHPGYHVADVWCASPSWIAKAACLSPQC